MTTSGTYDFSVTGTNIVTDALFKCGAAAEDEALPPEQISSGLRQLNAMVKFINKKYGLLWRRDEVYLFLASAQSRYLLGPAATDAEWCLEEDFVSTTLDGAHSSGATDLTVASTTGMANGDRAGLELSDGTRTWFAITSVDDSTGLTVPAIAGDAADDATLYTYTTRPQRPVRVTHARRKEGPTGQEIPIEIESQELYRDQPMKTTNGSPVMATYKPTLTSGRFELWQPPSSVRAYLGLTVERPLEDFDAAGNTPDFPQEWYDPLVWMLADRLEPDYRVLDQLRVQKLSAMAQDMWGWVENYDDDGGSFYIQPNIYG